MFVYVLNKTFYYTSCTIGIKKQELRKYTRRVSTQKVVGLALQQDTNKIIQCLVMKENVSVITWSTSVVDLEFSERGPSNMKYKPPLAVAIFVMTSFNSNRWVWLCIPLPPSGSALIASIVAVYFLSLK